MPAAPSYITTLSCVATFIQEHGKAPRVMSTAGRTVSYLCCPFACALCCCWSTCWRIIACPWVCLCKGPAYACSNNGCTDIPDAIIGAYVKNIDEPLSFATFDVQKAANADLFLALELINKLQNMFALTTVGTVATVATVVTSTTYKPWHYVLCDVVVRPLTGNIRVLPCDVEDMLNLFQASIRREIDTWK